MSEHASWGKYPRVAARAVLQPLTEAAVQAALTGLEPALPIGNQLSQGDSCLNENGVLLDMRGFNHFLSFDRTNGVVRCEAGVTLADIVSVVAPRGWFLSVTPGTKYITVGGAIANDVHGKNHETAGTFGNHVRRFKLLRSTGEALVCSPEENSELFYATIGGLGLTGVIVWAEVQLKPITSSLIEERVVPFSSLTDFFAASAAYSKEYEYSVAWLNCVTRGKKMGQGHLLLGNHSSTTETEPVAWAVQPRVSLPFTAPGWLINYYTVAAFSWAWRRRRPHVRDVHLDRFFYPLDAVGSWNRVYGRPGFFQYQCVVPLENSEAVVHELVERIAASKLASFLSTIKYFGDVPSLGLLSFARPGVCLAVDFANKGQRTLDLFNDLDRVVQAAGGALYPAKDSRMSPAMFLASFPRVEEFRQFIDPALSSSFWRRIIV